MFKYLYLFFVLLILLFSIQEARAEGYEIKIRIKNLAGKNITMGHHLADKLISVATLKLDNVGIGTLKGNGRFPEGIYFFMTQSHAKFDFFMTSAQRFYIETDTLNLFDNLKFYNSPENTAAQEYLKFMVTMQRESARLKASMKSLTDSAAIKRTDSRLKEISVESQTRTDKLIQSQKNNFVGTYINAMKEIEIPEPPRDSSGKISDSLFQYRYYRTHYFDNMNLRDARFLRTPVYDQKIKEYLDKVIPQIPDSVNRACDNLLNTTESYTEVFRSMLVTLFTHYADSKTMGFDAVYVHLAEDWIMSRASISDTAFIRDTQENVSRMKPILNGKTAPDLHMLCPPAEHFKLAKTDTLELKNPNIGSYINLSQINSRYTILVFWESDCGHCKIEVPELYEVYQRLKPKGVEVFAVHMLAGIEGNQKWISFVNEHELYDWINAWSPDDFAYKKEYVFNTTPSIFILDKDKRILAKYLNPKQTEDFLNIKIKQDEKDSKKSN
jgi:thiol-disulfide isomerase/thioredoxin